MNHYRIAFTCVPVVVFLLCESLCGQDSSSPSMQVFPDSAVPSVAYEYAIQPVQIVRRSPDNLTEADRYAWSVALTRAAHACKVRMEAHYSGEELFALGKLCALGHEYGLARRALLKYSSDTKAPNALLARALLIRCHLATHDISKAQQVAGEILDSYAYDPVVHTATEEVLAALKERDEVAAEALALKRFPLLLGAIRSGKPLRSSDGSEIPPAMLFHDGLALASTYKLSGREKEADQMFQALGQAVSSASQQIDSSQHHLIHLSAKKYLLLGRAAPAITYYRANSSVRTPAVLQVRGKVTVLVFFTAWCPQCLKVVPGLTQLAKRYSESNVQIFAVSTPAILAEDGLTVAEAQQFLRQQLKPQLGQAKVLLLADESRSSLSIEDYPAAVVIDESGKLQHLDELTPEGLAKRGHLDRLIERLSSPKGVDVLRRK